MENLETTKYSFWGLLEKFNKIEIPILQRDYAQGRKDCKSTDVRNKFLDDILEHVKNKKPMELDFVYGTEEGVKVFIPLDGQQRLTTLFLLHWYLANMGKVLNDDVKKQLSKFTYETRPSSNDFCYNLVMQGGISEDYSSISKEIKNTSWYHFAWDNDPTIQSMLVMLQAIHDRFNKKMEGKFQELKETNLITFYFLNLEHFGLTNNLYIKMNARGKELTPFENFKSEFEIILERFPVLLENFKDRIEGLWLENFWPFRSEDCTIDKAFMNYLYFISEMIYIQKGLNETKTTSPFEYVKVMEKEFRYRDNLKLLEACYQDIENIKILFFALDNIKELNSDNSIVFGNWGEKYNSSQKVSLILNEILKPVQIPSIEKKLVLYSIMYYSLLEGDLLNRMDFIRVVRNLVHNSDLEYRFLQNQIKSIEKLIGENVYNILLRDEIFKELTGFKEDQRYEEIFKAKLLQTDSNRNEIFRAEDAKHIEGNITCIITASYASKRDEIKKIKIKSLNPDEFNVSKLSNLTDSYILLSEDLFVSLIGDLFLTDVYYYNSYRLIFTGTPSAYLKYNGPLELVFEKAQGNNMVLTKEEFAVMIEKEFVRDQAANNQDLSQIRDVRIQLYLYYILTVRIQKIPFFNGNRWNFGWLSKTTGYSSMFSGGMQDSQHWDKVDCNAIFQNYGSQFRYTFGLREDRAIPMECTKRGNRPRNPFEKLKAWAEEK